MEHCAKERLDEALEVVKAIHIQVDREILNGQDHVCTVAYEMLLESGMTSPQAKKEVASHWFKTVQYNSSYRFSPLAAKKELRKCPRIPLN